MKKTSKMQIAVWVIALAPLLATALSYGGLPARIPMRWDLYGEIDYADKAQIWLVAGLGPVVSVLFYLLPKIDPRRRNYDKFGEAYLVFQLAMLLFLLVITGVLITEGMRPGTVDMSVLVCALASLLLIVIGNMMPKFRQNWFCGFKTPWTISSKTVWARTHRLAGRLLFAAGVLGLAGCLLPVVPRFILLLSAIAAAMILPAVMSCLWYRREQGKGSAGWKG